MNLGGTEKSFLSLVETLPEEYEIDLLLLEKNGELLSQLPSKVNVIEDLSARNIYNYTQATPVDIIKSYFVEKRIGAVIKGLSYYLLYKFTGSARYIFKIFDHEIPDLVKRYDIAIAFAGPHNFISYLVGEKIQAEKKIQWIHFDVSVMNFDKKTSGVLYRYFDEIKIVSKIAQKNFLTILPSLMSKTSVVSNIINVQKIKQLSDEPGVGFYDPDFEGVRILTVGRLTTQKGHDFAIPAIRKLVDQGYDIRYYIIGKGVQEYELKKQTEKLDLNNYITFLGAQLNPYPFMKQTDIYLQPSRHEGEGITVLEAKIFNKPIVLTNYTVAYDTIEHEKNGLIVETNSEAIFTALKRLLDDKELREIFTDNLTKEHVGIGKRPLPF